MKRIYYLIGILAIALALISCEKETVAPKQSEVTMQNNPELRTSYIAENPSEVDFINDGNSYEKWTEGNTEEFHPSQWGYFDTISFINDTLVILVKDGVYKSAKRISGGYETSWEAHVPGTYYDNPITSQYHTYEGWIDINTGEELMQYVGTSYSSGPTEVQLGSEYNQDGEGPYLWLHRWDLGFMYKTSYSRMK